MGGTTFCERSRDQRLWKKSGRRINPYCAPRPKRSKSVDMAYSDDAGPETTAPPKISLENCGMARAAMLLGDRWTLLVVREALYGVTRFDAIKADLGLPRSVLSDRLKRLTEAGVLTKRPYREPGQRARRQYVLTPMGVDLALPLIALMQWGDKHIRGAAPAAAIVERGTGAPLSVGLISSRGAPVPLPKAQFRVNR